MTPFSFFAKITYCIMRKSKKGRYIYMILTTLLIIAALITIAVLAFSVLAGGVGFLLVFGDVIVFVLVVVGIIKSLTKKKKSKK